MVAGVVGAELAVVEAAWEVLVLVAAWLAWSLQCQVPDAMVLTIGSAEQAARKVQVVRTAHMVDETRMAVQLPDGTWDIVALIEAAPV